MSDIQDKQLGIPAMFSAKDMIDFASWFRERDTIENAEEYFGYTDEDMLNEFLKDRK